MLDSVQFLFVVIQSYCITKYKINDFKYPSDFKT